VARYLRHAIALFRKRHGRPAGPRWHSIPRSGIHALLRLAQGQWPPAPRVTCVADAVRFTICDEYKSWLREARGLARPSIVALLWEARHFLAWQLGRCGADSLMELNVGDIDRYMDLRAPKLTRKSLKDVAERLRSLLRHLHRTGRTAIDLSPHVISPLLYAYEGVPSILERGQIAAVLESTRKDTTPVGLRDHAILLLLATYGLRSSEVRNLRLDDIDWRAESTFSAAPAIGRSRNSRSGSANYPWSSCADNGINSRPRRRRKRKASAGHRARGRRLLPIRRRVSAARGRPAYESGSC
jgi:integrase/recombinase XerD